MAGRFEVTTTIEQSRGLPTGSFEQLINQRLVDQVARFAELEPAVAGTAYEGSVGADLRLGIGTSALIPRYTPIAAALTTILAYSAAAIAICPALAVASSIKFRSTVTANQSR
jgi:hypothetical protein